MSAGLSLRHAALALGIVVVWGLNFTVIKVGLAQLPPLLFAALRFAFAAFPAVLFLRRPPVALARLAGYGVLVGVGQFGLLFFAIDGRIAPGLASLVIQAQVFFTIGLAMVLSGERLAWGQWLALALGVAGIGVIVANTDGATTLDGIALALGAALSWAGANIIQRHSVGVDMLAYVVWASLFAVPPLLLLSLAVEGAPAITAALARADAGAWGAVAYQSVANVMFGYGAWGFLLTRYPAATIAPTSLLVPVFGMAAAAWWLGEALPAWKLAAAGLVMAGLALNLLWPRLARRWLPPAA